MKRIINYIKEMPKERLVWCLVVAAFCWTDVADYHHMVYNKKLCVWIVLGLFYAYKMGALEKQNRLLTAVSVLAGSAITVFYVATNFFLRYKYIYYNYTMGILSIILILQYALIIKRIWKTRKFPKFSWVSMLMICMLLYTQTSPHVEKKACMVMLILLLPYAFMEIDRESYKNIFQGIVDGLCLGFVICQGYTFALRHYFYYGDSNPTRFKGYRDYCTLAGMSYLQFYIGYLIRWAIWSNEGRREKLRKAVFVGAAFIVSLMYLTGGRSPVIGVAGVTVAVMAWVYRECATKKKFVRWIGMCALLAVLSLALYPAAYGTTRYLPAVLDLPDLQDSQANRAGSFATLILKQNFLMDGEWCEWSNKPGKPRREGDDIKYVTFAESLEGSLFRIVPGMNRLLMPFIEDSVFESRVNRITYLYEGGEISAENFGLELLKYCEEFEREIPKEHELLIKEYAEIIEILQKEKLELLKATEQDSIEAASQGKRGDSPETGWFEDDSYSSMELRLALQAYSLGKLRLLGNEWGAFRMYPQVGMKEWLSSPHNIFLNMGFDYGIPAMLLMISCFVLLIWQSWSMASEDKEPVYLIATALIIGIALFGWFENGYHFSNSYTLLFVLIAALWRKQKREDHDE